MEVIEANALKRNLPARMLYPADVISVTANCFKDVLKIFCGACLS